MHIAATIPGSAEALFIIPIKRFFPLLRALIGTIIISAILGMLVLMGLYITPVMSDMINIDAQISIDMKTLPCNISFQDLQNKFGVRDFSSFPSFPRKREFRAGIEMKGCRTALRP